MTRDIAGNSYPITISPVKTAYMVRIDLDTPIRINSTTQDLVNVYDSHIYAGVGDAFALTGIQAMREDTSNRPSPMELSAVVETSAVIDIQNTAVQGRTVQIWLLILNTSGIGISGGPIPYWRGRASQFRVVSPISAGFATITLTAETPLIMWRSSNGATAAAEEHRAIHPNDSFFDFVGSLQDQTVSWGGAEIVPFFYIPRELRRIATRFRGNALP